MGGAFMGAAPIDVKVNDLKELGPVKGGVGAGPG